MCDEESAIDVAEWPTEQNMIAELPHFNESIEALETDVRFAFEFWDEENIEEFADRHLALCDRAKNFFALLSAEMSESIGIRLSALSRSLDQLRLRHEASEVSTQNSASSRLRKWLQKTEWEVDRLRDESFDSGADITELQRIRAVLQTVQLEIDTDGQRLLRTTKRQIASRSIEEPWKSNRYSRTLETLETRYCNLYLAIVESLERVNAFIERTRIGDEESDRESTRSSEPPRKRSRHLGKTEEEEDEELMSAELDLSKRRTESDEWSSSKTHDVGYSSGENSIHEVSDPQSIRMRNDGSPLSNYYRTVPLDDAGVTDTETPRSIPTVNIVLPDEPDDPTHPIPDPDFDTTNDYQEVMRVIDEQLKTTMGTSWTELKSGQRRLSTPSKNRRSLPTTGKMSCDASSEDSDSQIPPILSISFSGRSSNFLDYPTAGFRKRRLTSKGMPPPSPRLTVSLSNSILKNATMEQSIYEPQTNDQMMTQSLNIPKTQRRRFIRRRIRRTASENANLGPQRDSICSDSSSTTFHDSGDAHFEWDEYKEESHVQNVPLSEDVEMNTETSLLTTLDVDEDFRTELAVEDELTDVENFLTRSTIELEGIRRLLSANETNKRFALNAGRLANKNLQQIRSLLQKDSMDQKGTEILTCLNNWWADIVSNCPVIMDKNAELVGKINKGFIDLGKRNVDNAVKLKETDGEHEDTCSDTSISSSDPNPRKRINGLTNGAAAPRSRRHSSVVSAAPIQRTEPGFCKTMINCFVLIGIGLFLLFLVSDREYLSRSGYLGYRYGPTLRYVNGPPPV